MTALNAEDAKDAENDTATECRRGPPGVSMVPPCSALSALNEVAVP